MKYKLKFSKQYDLLLTKHLMFIAKASKEYARKLNKKFYSELKVLQDNPFLFQDWCPDFELPKHYKRLAVDNYLIIYYIEKDSVYIDFLLDARQENSKYF